MTQEKEKRFTAEVEDSQQNEVMADAEFNPLKQMFRA